MTFVGTKAALVTTVIRGIKEGRLALVPKEVFPDKWTKMQPEALYKLLKQAAENAEKEINAMYNLHSEKCTQRTQKNQEACDRKNEQME